MTSFCFFCGSPGNVGSACAKCFVPMPNPAASAHSELGRCPRGCASCLSRIDMDRGARIHACARCGGAFLDPRAWCALLERAEVIAAVAKRLPRASATTLPHADVAGSTFACAFCSAPMERAKFGGASEIAVDVCAAHGVWLGAGDLPRLGAFIASRPRPAGPPLSHPLYDAVEEERRRIAARARDRRRSRWLKALPVVLFAAAIAARWYFVAHPDRLPFRAHGEATRRAGEATHEALSR